MKKIIGFFIAAILLFSVSSCKKDKDKPELTGVWKFEKEEWKETYQGDTETDTVTFNATDLLTINADGAFTIIVDQDQQVGTWKREGDKITLTAVDGNDVDISVLDIKEHTSSSLVLYYKETDTDYVYEATTYLKR